MIACYALPTGVYAQSIALNPATVEAMVNDLGPKSRIIMINGPNISVLRPGDNANQQIKSAGLTKLLVAAITQRLIAEGAVELDTPVSGIIPEIVEANPFERAVTVRHLLQETAGFATPPSVLQSGPKPDLIKAHHLKKFIIKQRSADQLSAHDPVGWAVLVHTLEAAVARPFPFLVKQHFTIPFGLSPSDATIQYAKLSGKHMPVLVSFSEEAATTLAQLLVSNSTINDKTYVPRSRYNAWHDEASGHRLHPNANISMIGFSAHRFGGRTILSSLNSWCGDNTAFTAFPREGSAFLAVSLDSKQTCASHLAKTVSERVATNLFPPVTPSQTLALPPSPSTLSGRYIRADTAPAWLRERLDQMTSDWFTIGGFDSSGIHLTATDGTTRIYRTTGPYMYESADPFHDSKDALIFSPFKLGGYVIKNNDPYRRIDILGVASAFEQLLPWILLTLASGGIYRFTMKDRAWRNMAVFTIMGTALVSLGLYMELTAWPHVLYEQDKAWLISSWRVALNIGLMAVLTVPMFTVSFSRKDKLPQGLIEPVVKLHLILLSASAISLLLMLVAWGVAGTFSAY